MLDAAAWIGAGLSALGLTDFVRVKWVRPGTRMVATALAERAARQWFGLKHSANQGMQIRALEREVAAQTRTINRLLAALEVASRLNSMIGSSSPFTDSDSDKPRKRPARRARSSRKPAKPETGPTAPSPDS